MNRQKRHIDYLNISDHNSRSLVRSVELDILRELNSLYLGITLATAYKQQRHTAMTYI